AFAQHSPPVDYYPVLSNEAKLRNEQLKAAKIRAFGRLDMRVFRGIPARADVPIALTIGNFDGVHLGHRAMITRLIDVARRKNLPAALMTFEPQPQEFFAPDQAPPRLTSLHEKLQLLRNCGVDRIYVCRFNFAFAQLSADEFVS